MYKEKLTFKLTCKACPEQYDVFDEEDRQVAYVRLRFGVLRVDIPNVGDINIYKKEFEDLLKGCFYSEKEKNKYLKLIGGKITD